MYKKELKIAKQAAKSAGKFLKKEFFNFDQKIDYKTGNERVTRYDKEANKIILNKLRKNFPDYGVLSEESGQTDKDSPYTWIIDPLDGTTNFTIHHTLFAVTIALLYKNKVVMGVIYNPILDEMYWATENNGSYKNGQKLKVSAKTDLKKSIITYCHGSGKTNTEKAYRLYRHFHDISHHCRHFGCTSLELAMLAAGDTQAHMISGAKIWDISAGTIIIKEAGGKVTDWKNKTWNKESKTILAANKKIHPLCLKELKKVRLA
ncbi:inositol monophosphatase [Patescibacteria group bacterium]|nr:inositol monophosphatase [Patescibacteria group bacterium]